VCCCAGSVDMLFARGDIPWIWVNQLPRYFRPADIQDVTPRATSNKSDIKFYWAIN
jgi:hypothetical protein